MPVVLNNNKIQSIDRFFAGYRSSRFSFGIEIRILLTLP